MSLNDLLQLQVEYPVVAVVLVLDWRIFYKSPTPLRPQVRGPRSLHIRGYPVKY